jgi:hypothetical protein
MTPLSSQCLEALVRFETFYAMLDLALDREDCEQVAALVEERGKFVHAVVASFSGGELPANIRARIEENERRVHARIVHLYDTILRALTDERRRQVAASRYAEVSR